MSNTNYVYMNESSINDLLKCKICLKPFINPVITRDNDRFCRTCVSRSSYSGDDQNLSFIQNLVPIDERLLIEMLDNLPVQCVKCQQINIRRVHFEQHEINECSRRIISCQASDLKCPWTGAYEELNNHITTCTFQLLRPILIETLQYKTIYDEQKNEIEELKKQIEQYENQTDKLKKGFQYILEVTTQQRIRYDEFKKEIIEHNNQRDELRNEIQELKEQYNQLHVRSDGFHTELQRLDQLEQSINQDKKLTNMDQLNKQQIVQFEEFQNEFGQFKERFNREINQFNDNKVEVKQLREYETQIKQIQKQDQLRTTEVLRIRQICDQHDIQIHLLARKKCVIPAANTYNDVAVEALIEKFHSDTEIDLHEKRLIDRDMDLICKGAITTKQCRKLRLEKNEITAKGVTIIADALYNNTTLVELYLANNRISDMGVHAISQVLSIHNGTLAWLDLQCTDITDEGAEYLAEMLKTNKTITLLQLASNRITDRGVRLLANAIAYYNEILEWLYLASNKLITDTSADALVQMLKYNPSLKGLWVNDCNLSPNAIGKLLEVTKTNTNFILEV